ncbi:MAG: aryl-sulfate sulfotransferase [Deltaproteobacteria bacterium]|nr:aryl-sulfate sulfotransferase [Deltaproteobacteria bacterium]
MTHKVHLCSMADFIISALVILGIWGCSTSDTLYRQDTEFLWASDTDTDAGQPNDSGTTPPTTDDKATGDTASTTDSESAADADTASAPADDLPTDPDTMLSGSDTTTDSTDTAQNDSGEAPADSDTVWPEFSVAPLFRQNDNPHVPQAGILDISTNITADISINVSGSDGEEWQLSRIADTQLRVPVIGLKPQTEYAVTVTATANGHTIEADAGTWATPPLPDDFPPLHIAISEPAQMEPGMIQFNVWNGTRSSDKPLVIVDNDGVVRWYYTGVGVYDDHRRLENGHVIFTPDECVIHEVDALGNTVESWYAINHPGDCDVPDGSIPVDAESFHHAMTVLENGNLLALSTELRDAENFPTSEDDAAAPTRTTRVMASVIVEFTPAGQIVKKIPLFDLLDPTRIGRGVLSASWGLLSKYEDDDVTTEDWDHSNALEYDAAADAYLVSVRHQDAIIKINRETETLEWILGTPANWRSPWREKLFTPDDTVEWFFHQHAVVLTPLGIGMYDNGNFRAPAYEPTRTQYSRAVLFSIDEEAMTVSQIWDYGSESGENHFYSSAMGNAIWQPQSGNVLICNGWMGDRNGTTAQILEITEDGERVFELTAMQQGGSSSYAIHRARRIADIRL